jgi:ssDNA-binding Zn-finger/Zn-ribbon topoisomerase 1
MPKAVKLNIKGIKCDHCNYQEPDVEFKDYDKWLNKPCPKCGENLLTKADLESLKMLVQATNAVNKLFTDGSNEDQNSSQEQIKVPVEMNGTGKINIKFGSQKI